MKTPHLLAVGFAIVTLSACAGSAPTPTPTPSPTTAPTIGPSASSIPLATPPSPSPSSSPGATPAGTSATDLKYVLLTQIGRPDWCDRDFYPVAQNDEGALARQHLVEMKSDADLFSAILSHLGIDPSVELTGASLLAVYQDWKVLSMAIVLTPVGDAYTFDYIALVGPVARQNDFHVAGTIDHDGKLKLAVNEPSQGPMCPICLARGTLIDTPDGTVPVERLRAGMLVWTTDESGRRVAAPIVLVGSTPVPTGHRVVHLELSDGRIVDVSPGHPLADGRLIGDLRAGDQVDGSTVISAELVAYAGGATFDLLPAGSTGAYWANGILIGSTLSR